MHKHPHCESNPLALELDLYFFFLALDQLVHLMSDEGVPFKL